MDFESLTTTKIGICFRTHNKKKHIMTHLTFMSTFYDVVDIIHIQAAVLSFLYATGTGTNMDHNSNKGFPQKILHPGCRYINKRSTWYSQVKSQTTNCCDKILLGFKTILVTIFLRASPK